MIVEKSKELKKVLKDILENKNFENKFNVLEINNDKPFTLCKDDYLIKEGKPQYTDSNKFGKSGMATAIISKNTLAIYTSKYIKYPEPINWKKLNQPKKILKNKKEVNIFQKCHIIGYHLSARFSTPHNIFIGTNTLNHGAMLKIENDIYDEVSNNNRIFIYKVIPVYMFKNDIVPIGLIFEYETVDNKDKISHCKFCYNVEKGYKINYYNGGIEKIEETEMNTSIINEVKEASIALNKANKYQNYYINVKNKKFHLVYDEKEKCEELKYVRRKYIQETTANYEDILTSKEIENFSICEKCTKVIFDKINNNIV